MFASTFKFLLIALEVVAIFNLLIFVHELGHFLAAKWRGLYVDEFALWFGKPLWRKKINGVWYAINSIPAGGYVKLPQMAPMEALEGESEIPEEALRPVKPLDKIIVAFAGPLFSLLLAFVMATIVWAVGKPESEFDSPSVGYLKPGGPAEMAGLKVGDEILEVDGKKVTHFVTGTESVKWAIIRSEGDTIPFKIKRGDQIQTINSGWTKADEQGWRRPAFREVQIGPRMMPGIGLVTPGSIADQAGLRPGDLVTTANGETIYNISDLLPMLEKSRGGSLELTVDRGGTPVPVSLAIPATAAANAEDDFPLGIGWGRYQLRHPNPVTQVYEAATTIFRMVGALTSSKSDVKASHFSGPVGIMKLYYQVFQNEYAWQTALALSVLINVNLALLNMLPLPVLDGGHIMLALIESIRRKPMNLRVLEIMQTACAVVLIGFMLYVTFFDVGDFFGKKDAPKPVKQEEIAAPPAPK